MENNILTVDDFVVDIHLDAEEKDILQDVFTRFSDLTRSDSFEKELTNEQLKYIFYTGHLNGIRHALNKST